MAGFYPTTPQFQTVNFQINTPTLTVNTASGKTQRVGMGHSFYTFSAQYNNMLKRDARQIHGFLAAQFGQLESFQILLPEISYTTVENQYSANVYTDTFLEKGSNSVFLDTLAQSGTVLNAGDFFKFNNHSKVYQVVQGWEEGSKLFFSGGTVEDVPNGTELTITAVPFTVILNNNVQEWETGIGGITTMSVDFREVW